MPNLTYQFLQEQRCKDCQLVDELNEHGVCAWCHELRVIRCDNFNNWKRQPGHPKSVPYVQPMPGHTHSIGVGHTHPDPKWEAGHGRYEDGDPFDEPLDDAIRNFVPPAPAKTDHQHCCGVGTISRAMTCKELKELTAYEKRAKFALAFARSIPPEGRPQDRPVSWRDGIRDGHRHE